MELTKILENTKSEIRSAFLGTLFRFDYFDDNLHCYWYDGPTIQQVEYYLNHLFPMDKVLSPFFIAIKVNKGLDLLSTTDKLSIRLFRSTSLERRNTIEIELKKQGIDTVLDYEMNGMEQLLIDQNQLSGYILHQKGKHYFLKENTNNVLSFWSNSNVVRYGKSYKSMTSDQKLIITVLFQIYGQSRVMELLADDEFTLNEIFESAAYVMFGDGS
ncbi:hypothetical protein BK120_23385 [Paenibacillus sp. FSL A5-0031]|uniref:hypothetical protein n=1 Tax=Paenibacillus sp. FSL A5-0031 TaxID=1920420 RepID=UPI00096ECC27|nr:hypothetical protein [Paenibacillus sp. FSL A5-0031]OME78685.1 hypothetical protein BK120_23385 [Paenibacillus sp. FSL A5-0031]